MQEEPTPSPHDDELAPVDDAVIGRAFRRSLLVFAALGVVLCAALLWRFRPQATVEIEDSALVPPRTQTLAAQPPAVAFRSVGESAGIDFLHESGARGKKLLPETMGSGCAFLDYDGDGDQDLLLANGVPWEENRAGESEALPTMALYANDGSGNFRDVTRDAGLEASFYGTGVAVGDYDNDGDVDLFLAAVGANHLFRNQDGRFEDVSSASGVQGAADAWSTSAGFFDYDNDGRLDLFVCNYVRWSPQIDFAVNFQLTGIGRAYGPPTQFAGTHSSLYRNLGDGRFEDVSAAAGIEIVTTTGEPMGKALGLAPLDLDGDGAIDIIVANDTVKNFLFHNQGDGTFRELGTEAGLAFDSNGAATGAMGLDVAHFRNDDALAVGVGNFANEMTSLYVTQGSSLLYSDEAITTGIGPTTRLMLSFGLFFFDYDLDGWLDLFQTNGHLEEEINVVQPSQHYHQPAQIFWNSGNESAYPFTPVDPETTGDLATPVVGRAAAYADIDGDGDLDLVVTQVGERPLLLRNDQSLEHHWLRVRLVARRGNRDAIGAWVELRAGDLVQERQVMPTRSYLSQVELPITFGLGDNADVETLTVTWPDGTTQTVADVPVDRLITVEQTLE